MLEPHKRRATEQRLVPFAQEIDRAGAVTISFLETALRAQAILEAGIVARRADKACLNGGQPELPVFKAILTIIIKTDTAAENLRRNH